MKGWESWIDTILEEGTENLQFSGMNFVDNKVMLLYQKVGHVWERSKNPALSDACWNHLGENFKLMICKFHPRDATAFIGSNLKCPPNAYSQTCSTILKTMDALGMQGLAGEIGH